MPDLVAGSEILAADHPVTQSATDRTTIGPVSSTTYQESQNFSGVVETTFVAPTSGRVLVVVGCGAEEDASGGRISLAPQVFEGVDASGLVILPPHAGRHGVISANTASQGAYWSRITMLEGLTPGRSHYARLLFRSTDGIAATLEQRDLTIVPVP